jgi:8-oxo-dGTP pyrophosphatase MutT (NUDIX family)
MIRAPMTLHVIPSSTLIKILPPTHHKMATLDTAILATARTESSRPETQTGKPAAGEYSVSTDISAFQISPADLLASRPDIHNIIAGAMVFRSSPEEASGKPRSEVLLLQRAASDSFPLKWEIPAGTADPTVDHSIIEVAVRELWEETGLRAHRLHQTVGLGLPPGASPHIEVAGDVEDARMDSEYPIILLRVTGRTWAVATFLVDVGDDTEEIALQEEEHVRWAWVTESEVETGRFLSQAEESFDLVSEAMKSLILEGFRIRKISGL